MMTLFRTEQIYTLKRIKEIMAAHIRALPHKISPVGTPSTILRLEFPIEPMDILVWLHNQHVDRKVYWSDRESGFEIGGIGVADSVQGEAAADHEKLFEYMQDRLSADNANLRYYGGMRFNADLAGDDWQEFGAYQFVVPQFEVLRSGKEILFAFNIALKDIQKENIGRILKELGSIGFSPNTAYRTPPKVRTRRDLPDKEGWNRIFAKIKDEEGRLIYEKIVLARKSAFTFDKYIDPVALLKHLKDRTPNFFHFCFQTKKTTAFLGATPELLYRREQGHIVSAALAGTAPRGRNEDEDVDLGKELRACAKNMLEHRYVVEAIKKRLEEKCFSVSHDDYPDLLKLRGGQHLITKFQAVLKEGISDGDILACLHPTPAVCGCPPRETFESIGELEPFDRGWYAGPIGYIGYDRAEFAVAIRSALVKDNKLSLYAGAGIVEGSTAESEWEEIEAKIGNFIEVFNKK